MMATKKSERKKWTFMVYLAGDNNLDGNGVIDLAEMKKVGSDDNLNLIAQFDRAGRKNETKRFYLRRGTKLTDDAVMKLGETNSGSPAALTDFIRWGVQTYPAERYALVLWNHGGGWDDTDVYAGQRLRSIQRPANGRIRHALFFTSFRLALRAAAGGAKSRAILYDDNARDFLDNREMKKVLADAKKAVGRKLDLLGLDACLMSMAEVACQVSASVRFSVGSEQTEPLEGWPYNRLLSELARKPDMPAKNFANVIVDQYIASYPSSEAVTQSACDLEKSTALMQAVKEMANLFSAQLDRSTVLAAIARARTQVQSYEVPDNIDLIDFCALLAGNAALDAAAKETCRKVIHAAGGKDGMVVKSGCKGDSVKDSRGIAIYFPATRVSPLYAELDFARKTGWGRFLNRYLAASRRR
jgi:hypothetical protein